ncbi:MAG: AsnC family transcriptional regulator [Magnetococcus sp. WYHC-3]
MTMSGDDLDDMDRRIVNALQEGLDPTPRPYADAARMLGLEESHLLERLERLLQRGILSRFGPLYHPERLGGGLTLAALAVPPERFDAVAAQVNAFPQVAHNYQRDHFWNMWFVVATEHPRELAAVLQEIEASVGLPLLNLPKVREFQLQLRLTA